MSLAGEGPASQPRAPSWWAPDPLDADTLLVALVMVPSCLSRNRYPALFHDAASRRARRRAAAVRGIARQLLHGVGGMTAELEGVSLGADQRVKVVYRVPRMGLRRAVTLSPTEMAALRWVVHRGIAGRWKRPRPSRIAPGIERLLGDWSGTRAALIAALARMSPAKVG